MSNLKVEKNAISQFNFCENVIHFNNIIIAEEDRVWR